MTFQTMTSSWTMNATRTLLSDLLQGHKTRTHELHEHEFELDTETSRLMGSGFYRHMNFYFYISFFRFFSASISE